MRSAVRTSRTVVAALVIVALVAACSGDDESDDPALRADDLPTTSSPSTTGLADVEPPAPAAGSVEISAGPPRRTPAGPVTWTIEFTNVSGEAITLTFPSGQPGDAVIAKDDGTVVHRWSDGRFFDQAIQELVLVPGQTERVELPDDLTGVETGFYELRLELAVVAPPEPFQQNLRITKAEG